MVDEGADSSGRSERERSRVLLAAMLLLALFVAITALSWWLSTTRLNGWQRTHLGWNYSLHVLFLFIPLCAVLVDHSRLESYAAGPVTCAIGSKTHGCIVVMDHRWSETA